MENNLLTFPFFSKFMVLEQGICDHDLRKEIKILVEILLLFSVVVFNMMNLLAILQFKGDKVTIKESHSKI